MERMMEAFTNLKGIVTLLDLPNVDTDQIIPKQFLKRIERTGFGQFLFYDWRFLDGRELNPEFEMNQERLSWCPDSRDTLPTSDAVRRVNMRRGRWRTMASAVSLLRPSLTSFTTIVSRTACSRYNFRKMRLSKSSNGSAASQATNSRLIS